MMMMVVVAVMMVVMFSGAAGEGVQAGTSSGDRQHQPAEEGAKEMRIHVPCDTPMPDRVTIIYAGPISRA